MKMNGVNGNWTKDAKGMNWGVLLAVRDEMNDRGISIWEWPGEMKKRFASTNKSEGSGSIFYCQSRGIEVHVATEKCAENFKA